MNFEFSEEQLAIRDTIRELVQDKVAPRAAEIDEKAEYPKDIEKLFADNGILAIPFPEEYGGISGSSVSICMGIEEIAKGVHGLVPDPGGPGAWVLSDPGRGLRGAEEAALPTSGRRAGGCLRPFRSRVGVGRGGHEDDRTSGTATSTS